jgi:MFS family permease
MTTLDARVDVAAVQRRTIGTLVAAQAVGAVGITIGIATASLLAEQVSGSERQAGLAQTFQVLGAAVMAFVLARVMARRGRRVGLVSGYLTGSAGAVLVVLAGVVESMPLLLLGAAMLGSSTAANSAARYAATDLAPAPTRARALSLVVWATTIGAVAGPNLTGLSAEVARRLAIPELTGPFALAAVGMLAAAFVIGLLLRPDPLLTARVVAAEQPPPAAPVGSQVGARVESQGSWRRVAGAVRERPVLAAATGGLAGAHAVMVSVMVMTPLHMQHGGAELRVIGIVISVHVLGMFAFSPVVGWLADKVGRATTLFAGGVVLLVSLVLCGLAPEGSSWQIFAGLFLLGLGWSFATVAASTMIADHAPLELRTEVQGAADLVMGLTAAGAGGLAGLIVGVWGYPTLAATTAVLAVGVLLAATYAGRHASEGVDEAVLR